ncbi:MAG: hypothetical protein QXI39_05885 [Candidatus Bathyarchaeia archaeon]
MSETKYLPRRLSFDKLCGILVAYLNAGADREYVSVKEASSKVDIEPKSLSRNNGFLKSWGFLEESQEALGRYKLSPDAAEFASAYRIDPKSEVTRRCLERLLSKEAIINGLVERIKREAPDRSAILVELPRITGDLKADKVGLNAFLDMLIYAFRLEDIIKTPAEKKPPTVPKLRATKPLRVKFSKELGALRIPFTINISISPETSVEKLKESIKAILEAYDEYLEKISKEGDGNS